LPALKQLQRRFAGQSIVSAPTKRAQERIHESIVRENDGGRLMDSFINETMRYFPPIPFVIREATSDVAVGDLNISGGSLILLSVVGVHHHPEFWHEPQVFDSFRAEFMEDTYDRRALIPFLAGPRICGGMKLARLEVAEGLKAFMQEFHVVRTSEEVEFDYGLALRPNSWHHLRITRRRET
jgi:cytochrome P450